MTQTVAVETFGDRLRELRQRAGMSQVEVGGSKYSGSYVSYLESGRRRPTEEVVVYLADRLGVGARSLLETDHFAYSSGSPELDLMEAQAAIRDAQAYGDQRLVCDRSEHAAHLAAERRRADVWWYATQCRMRALMKLDLTDEAIEAGQELLRHHITAGSARLQSEILTSLARCHRARGDLDTSIELSHEAILAARSGGGDHPDSLANALVQHVSSLLSAGGALAAQEWLDEMRAVRRRIGSPQVLGLIAWVLGNAAFLSGDADGGNREHATATELLRAEIDLQVWGRFRQASARMQLEVGQLDGVDELIESAAFALGMAGSGGDLANLSMVRALHAAAHGRHGEALSLFASVLADPQELSLQAVGEVHELRHRSLLALGDVAAAREALKQAAAEYERAKAWARAIAMWRAFAQLESEDGPAG